MKILPFAFFDRPHGQVARDLLGRELVVGDCRGRVVETEAYAYHGDAACHVAFRPSSRAFVDAHPPGTAYCYLNYGLHWLLNVLAADGIILLRAAEPIAGISTMQARRGREKLPELASGPGKLGAAFGLGRDFHGLDATSGHGPLHFGIGQPVADEKVACGPRIGISQAVDLPWRFWISGHACVSRGPRARATRPQAD